ncbi:relaxase MobL [Dielma fastidiosa]|uniref:relaxase MobL n=1 Tax=Dielma fastidiosa TaxID=1034346 RepID=UPI0023F1C759|nr:relaxase MobL [Dielma fastidiosa]
MKRNDVSTFNKIKFGQFGREAPKGSRFKGTLGTAALVGWYDYTNRSDANENQTANTFGANETGNRPDGFFGYTSNKTHDVVDGQQVKAFSSIGWLNEDNVRKFKSEVAKAFTKQGDLFWMDIVSIKDYMTSEKYGLLHVDDYAAIVNKVLPTYFKYVGLDPDNMIWWMNYHNDTDNPHMHITFLEKEKTRTRGKFTQKEIGKYKALFAKEFGLREELKKEVGMDSKEYFKMKDRDKSEIIKMIQNQSFDPSKVNMASFYKKLPRTGRLQYNSFNMKPYKEELDAIIDKILETKEVKPLFEKWLESVTILEKTMNQSVHDNVATIRDTEIKKLYSNIGNMLLKNAKMQRCFEIGNTDECKKEEIAEHKAKALINSNKKMQINSYKHRFMKNPSERQATQMAKSYLKNRTQEIENEIEEYLKVQQVHLY